MVARMLNVCGLYLGSEGDLVNPTPDNPEGYWENRHVVAINQELLAAFGGGWDLPPALPLGWETASAILPLRARAEQLINEFAECERWGWKDPRCSLTLSFWKNLVPGLKVIVCIRDPLEVARSLYRRGYSSNVFSFRLWQVYNERLLAATRPEERLITHQDSYFVDPKGELRRLLDWLGWSVSDETIAQACSVVSARLRHHRVPSSELRAAGLDEQALTLYMNLCAEAGPVYDQSRRLDSPISLTPNQGEKPFPSAQNAAKGVDQLTNIGALQEVILQEEREIDALGQELRRVQNVYAQEVRRVQNAYAQLEHWAHGLEAVVHEREETLVQYERELGPVLRLWRKLRGRMG